MLTATRTITLRRLQDPDDAAIWRELDSRYRPLLVHYGRGMGLTREEAADAAQEGLTKFALGLRDGTYQRERGRLRPWLFTIIRRCALDQFRARKVRRGESAIGGLAAPAEDTDHEDECWQRAVLLHALDHVRSEGGFSPLTLLAFELYTLGSLPTEAVAKECGMTSGEVYVAKSRVLRRLREVIRSFDEGDDDGRALSESR
jgi:RNA polymerase sigma-70 factor (ECF subfamily)